MHKNTESFLGYLRGIEKKWQSKWQDSHEFEASMDKTKPKFFLTVPYPYPTGPLHVGHGLSYIIGDIDARYRRLQGYNVLFPMAFHITGSPIDSISSRIRNKDKETIDLYRDYVSLYVNDGGADKIVDSFTEPINVARFFSNNIKKDFDGIGLSIDWTRRFTTGDDLYKSFVKWQFNKLDAQGHISLRDYPILYSPAEKQAVGEDDIKGGDEMDVSIAEYSLIALKTKNGINLLAYSDSSDPNDIKDVVLNSDDRYCTAKFMDEQVVTSLKSVEKLALQGRDASFIADFDVSKLNGDKVVVGDRTIGLAIKKDTNDNFCTGIRIANGETKTGKNENETADKPLKMYEVSAPKRPVLTRSGSEVIVSVVKDQVFLDYSDEAWKSKARELLSSLEITPSVYRKQFEDAIEWVGHRPCARERGLGTKLPMDSRWIIEPLSDSTIYMAFYTVIQRLNGADASNITDGFWDYVFLGIGSAGDVAGRAGIEKERLEGIRNEFLYWYPVDVRHTATPHINNHLTFSIFNHAAIFPKELWPKSFVLNGVLLRNGEKMSKSKGNVIPLSDVSNKFSADVFRLYIASAVDLGSKIDWVDKGVEEMISRFMNFANTMEELLDLCGNPASGGPGKKADSFIGRWINERLNYCISTSMAYYEQSEYKKAITPLFYGFLDDLKAYIRYAEDANPELIAYIAKKWLITLSPIIPHIASEFLERFSGKGENPPGKWPVDLGYDPSIASAYEKAKSISADINRILKLTNKSADSKAELALAPDWMYDLANRVRDGNYSSLKEAMDGQHNYIESYGARAEKLIAKAFGMAKDAPRFDKNADIESLRGFKQVIIDSTRLKDIEIIANPAPGEALEKSTPMKPGILIVGNPG